MLMRYSRAKNVTLCVASVLWIVFCGVGAVVELDPAFRDYPPTSNDPPLHVSVLLFAAIVTPAFAGGKTHPMAPHLRALEHELP